jgi:PAS domain S-box-containing protein
MIFLSLSLSFGRGSRTQRFVVFIVCAALVGGLSLFWTTPARGMEAAEAGPRVLLLNSYHPQYPWTDSVVQGVKKGLRGIVAEEDLYIEFMDLRRHTDDSGYQALLFDLYSRKFRHTRFDLVICADDYALDFLEKHRARLFPGTPLVFCGVNAYDPGLQKRLGNVTGIFESMEVHKNLQLIYRLQPDVKRVVFLLDQTYLGTIMRRDVEQAIIAHSKRGVQFEIWDEFTLAELYPRLEKLEPGTVVQLVHIIADRAGSVFSYSHHTPILSRHCKVPIFGMWGWALGHGIVGGLLTNGELHGLRTAQIAKRVLQGETAASILPITKAAYEPSFDYAQLQRFGISLADLPAGSKVIGRPKTFYQIHKAYIWIGGAVILLLLFSLVVMARNILLRIQAEKELAYREALESLIAKISTRFVEQPLHQIDAGIDFALESLGRFATVDRCYLILFSEDRRTMTNTHEWCAKGIKSKKNSVQGLPAVEIPWFMAQIEQRQVVYVPQVNRLPETARAEKTVWFGQGTQSLVCAPIQSSGELIGFLGFNAERREQTWAKRDIDLLKTSGEILGGAIERQRAAVKLRDSEEQSRTLLENAADAIFMHDASGRFLYVNPRACEYLGYSQQELLQMKAFEIQQPFSARALGQSWQRIPQGQSEILRSIHRRKDGSTLPVEITISAFSTGFEQRFLSVVRDITERLKNEAQLKAALVEAEAARDRTDFILRSVADGLVVVDLQGRLTLMNRAAERISGLRQDEAVSRPISSVFREMSFTGQICAILAGVREEQTIEWVIPLPRAEQDQTIQAHSAPVLSRDGELRGAIAILRDVSRERELDRMKNEFISTAAHELRTPLTAVMGFTELLLNQAQFGLDDPDRQQELLRTIFDKAQRLEEIVSQLLDLSRMRYGKLISLKKCCCDISALLQRVVAEYRDATDQHRFDVTLPEGPLELLADRNKLEQVLENLLSNAVKFSPQETRIRVDARVQGSRLVVTVKDQGVGMNPEQLARVFDKFYRADGSNAAVPGLGLGMSIVKNIIESHGGEIWVESDLGQGTRVSFALPMEYPETFPGYPP